jgi:DNA glycosylase AlkZ-like
VSEAQAERAVATIERSLAEEGPLTRVDLRQLLDAADVPTEGQALIHLLFLAALRLLGAFDPVLLGWASRDPILGRHQPRVVSGGLFRPFAMAGGRAVGGWKWVKREVAIEPYQRLPAAQRKALEADVADVARFLHSDN